ncbi:MAG TPA: hypothetical protein G4O12_08215 [Dehalococcoidia bacterium]|nr:hypothetical protein [Dehalococcoidia bacterium]
MNTTDIKWRKRVRLAGLITGLFGASMGPVVWVMWAMPRFQQTSFSPFELLFMVMVLVRWGVVIAAMKWDLIGLLLILDGVFLATFLWDWPLGLLLFVSLPLLVSGILFLLSWREGWKQHETETD